MKQAAFMNGPASLIPKLNMAPASVGIDAGRAWTDLPLESA
jgi:hypothetical protein